MAEDLCSRVTSEFASPKHQGPGLLPASDVTAGEFAKLERGVTRCTDIAKVDIGM